MNYKRIIKSRRLRFAILRTLEWIPDSIMVRMQYRIKMGFWPNMKHPRRFTEKLQLYKLCYHNPDMPQCVDKYEVRKYVESKGLKHILNELNGLYDSFEKINFNDLPDKFVIKSTTGGGGLNVFVIKDKNICNWDEIRKEVKTWGMHKNGSYSYGREWAYSGMGETRIIIERFLEDNRTDGLTDYKFFCFQGKPYCVQVDTGRFDGHRQNYYDMNWQSLGVHCTYPEGEPQNCPLNFDEMKKVAEELSSDFPFVRVDLYNVNGKIYFGELTFYPSSGYGKFHPDEFDIQLGAYFTEY